MCEDGHSFTMVITDDCTGFRLLNCLNRMKNKDEVFRVFRKWYSDIAVLRDQHNLLVVMRDCAGENKSQELNEFVESKGIQNYHSNLNPLGYEQRQNGQVESSINSLKKLGRSAMVESGLWGQFWSSAAMAAKDARNATYKEHIQFDSDESMENGAWK